MSKAMLKQYKIICLKFSTLNIESSIYNIFRLVHEYVKQL